METIVIDIQARYKDKTEDINQSTVSMDRFSTSIKKMQGQAAEGDAKLHKIWQTAKSLGRTAITLPVKVLDYATRPLRSLFNYATSIKGVLTGMFAGAAASKMVKGPMAMADQIESATMFFEKKLGGVEAANDFLEKIYEFDKKSPFDTMQIIESVKNMMGVGWSEDDVLKDIGIIGDASASLGGGTEGVEGVARQLGQMRMKSKVSQEEINVLQERGINAWQYIADAMGVTPEEARELNEKKDSAIKGIDAVNMILAGMEDDFGGAAEGASDRTVSGIVGQLKSMFETKVLLKWGEGLASGAKKGLGKFQELLDKNEDRIVAFGEKLRVLGEQISTWASDRVETALNTVIALLDDPAFQEADLFGKIRILWDEVIAEPFSQWWGSTGKAWATEASNEIGIALGEFLSGGIKGLLGIGADTAGTVLSEGASIGKAFAEGFLEGFDGSGVWTAIKEALKNVFQDAATVLPGRETSGTGWLSAGLLGFGAYKLGAGKLISKAAKNGANKLFGAGGAATEAAAGATGAAEAAASAGAAGAGAASRGAAAGASTAGRGAATHAGAAFWESANLYNITRRSDAIGEHQRTFRRNARNANIHRRAGDFADDAGAALLKPAAKIMPVLSKAGKFVKGNALSLLFSGAMIASAEDKVGETVRQGGGLTGGIVGAKAGAAAGGAIGSVAGPAGTAVGAAAGGIAGGIGGWLGGEAFASWIYEKKDAIASWFTETGAGIATWFTNAKDGVGDWFKDAGEGVATWFTHAKDGVGQWFQDAGERISTWFQDVTEAVPQFFKEKKDQVVDWVKDIPNKLTEAAGSLGEFVGEAQNKIDEWGVYWTETVPNYWKSKVDDWGTYWTETVPAYWKGKVDEWGVYWTETVPTYWSAKVDEWGIYWTETVPAYWQGKVDEWGTFWGESVPAYWKGKVDEWGTFWGESVPNYWKGKVDEWGTFWGESVPNYWKTKVDEWGTYWSGVKTYWEGKIDSWGEFFKGIPGMFGTMVDNLSSGWKGLWGNFGKGYDEARNGNGTTEPPKKTTETPKKTTETPKRRNPAPEFFKPGKVTGKATGTNNAAPGLHWVGENGPELMLFQGGERIYNARQSNEMATTGYAIGAGETSPAPHRSDESGCALLNFRVSENIHNAKESIAFSQTGYVTGTNNATPSLHWVGENGPELMLFQGGETVYNARQSAEIMGTGFTATSSPVRYRETEQESDTTQSVQTATGAQINLGGIHIAVNGATDTRAVMEAIRQKMPEIANDLCELLYRSMGRTYQNMPT